MTELFFEDSFAGALTLAGFLLATSALAVSCPEGKGGIDVRAPDSTPASE